MTALPPSRPRERGLSRLSGLLARRLVVGCLGLALAAWVLVLLCAVVLHLWIVPRIDDYRPWVERQSSRIMGVPVQIDRLSAQSGRWGTAWTIEAPLLSLELGGVRIQDAQGKEGLSLPSLRVAVSPQSLLSGSLQHIRVDAPALEVRRTLQGTLRVAGFDIPGAQTAGADPGGRALQRWLFAQTEVTITGGEIRWSDDWRALAPVVFRQVNLSVRNSLRRHTVRLDALPPTAWGQHVSLDARFRQAWLSRNTGNWRDWNGHVDLAAVGMSAAPLKAYAAELGLTGLAGPRIEQCQGSWRAAVDFQRGAVLAATLDLDVAQASLRAPAMGHLTAVSPLLAVHELSGRLGFKQQSKGTQFSTTNLRFKLADGRRWPGGNASLTLDHAPDQAATGGALQADRLDIAALAQFAPFFGLEAGVQKTLANVAPQGVIDKLDGQWRGPLKAPSQFAFKGKASKLTLAPSSAVLAAPALGRPGVAGASVDFTVTDTDGKASLRIQGGSVSLPGVFQDPLVPLNSLSADLAWQKVSHAASGGVRNGGSTGYAVQATAVQFANDDTAGSLNLRWHSSEQAERRFPGVLELDATLAGAAAQRVARYLPLALPATVRDYVAATVQQGRLGELRLKIKGDLFDFPFRDPKQGEFRIATRVNNVQFAYGTLPAGWADPASVTTGVAMGVPPGTWPVLRDLSGDLVIDGKSLQLRGASAGLVGYPGLQITRGEATIADFAQGIVSVNLGARGPTNEALALVKASPVNSWTNQVLEPATASGQTETSLRLTLPLQDLKQTQVAGTVSFAATQFSLKPDLPPLQRGQGKLTFSESAFNVQATGDLLGGATRIEGGTSAAAAAAAAAVTAPSTALAATPTVPTSPATQAAVSRPLDAPSVVFTAQGVATAQALQGARDLGLVSHLADHASGQAAYTATVAVRHDVPEIALQTDLKGVALTLPPPFTKAADTAIGLRVDNHLLSASPWVDSLNVTWGNLGEAHFVRDVSGPIGRVLQGSIALGLDPSESITMPRAGVAANIKQSAVNIDTWVAFVTTLAADMEGATTAPPVAPATTAGSAASSASFAPASLAQTYLPTTFAVRAKDLTVKGQHFKNLVLGGSRDGPTWRANLDADELSGYVEYRDQADTGRVFARLSRLALAASTAATVESVLSDQPVGIPALDIVVEDLDLKSRKLGRLEIQATNRVGARREWRLDSFKLSLPEANLNATGRWATASPSRLRQTALNFNLDTNNAGNLLARFGMKDVLKNGAGKLTGDVTWTGSPLSLDYKSMSGNLRVDMGKGQFLKADPGLAKLLGVLSLQSLPRRLTLDFSDAFADGFAFDFVRGDARITRGIAYTDNLQMKGVSAVVRMTGQADIAAETQNLEVVVVPEINAGTASLLASVINPAIGLTTLLTQMVLRRPLIDANTQSFHIDGPWADPKVTRVTSVKPSSAKPTPPTPSPTTTPSAPTSPTNKEPPP